MKIDKDQPFSANQSLREPCHSVCFIMVLVNVYLRYVLCNNHMTIQRVSTVLYAVKMSFVVCFPFPWDYLKSHVGKITTRKLNIPAQIERHLILSSPWKKKHERLSWLSSDEGSALTRYILFTRRIRVPRSLLSSFYVQWRNVDIFGEIKKARGTEADKENQPRGWRKQY